MSYNTGDTYIIRMEKENAELRARVARLERAALIAIHSLNGGNAKAEVRDIYDETPQQSLAEIEAAAVEKCLPPVMTDTTIPVACRSPHDFMIGFNRCRNEIKRNAENQLRQQATGEN